MTPAQIQAWIAVILPILGDVKKGIAIVRQIFGLAGLSIADQDVIIDGVMADAQIQARLTHLASGRPD